MIKNYRLYNSESKSLIFIIFSDYMYLYLIWSEFELFSKSGTMPFNLDFTDKVVLVTGSSSGIGESTVVLFAELGAKVVVHGRDRQRVGEVAQKCRDVSPKKHQVW